MINPTPIVIAGIDVRQYPPHTGRQISVQHFPKLDMPTPSALQEHPAAAYFTTEPVEIHEIYECGRCVARIGMTEEVAKVLEYPMQAAEQARRSEYRIQQELSGLKAKLRNASILDRVMWVFRGVEG